MGAEVRKVPSPLPSSTDTVLDPLLVTTRSGRPSRLKSPTAMDVGVAVGRDGALLEVPLPLPPRTQKGCGPLSSARHPWEPQPLRNGPPPRHPSAPHPPR